MENKSETLRQREKAQRDLLELKKMQAGEMETGPKPSEISIKPQTFKEKKENFLYHYKYVAMGVVFALVVLTVLIVDIARRPDYDSKVVVFSYDMTYSAFNEEIAKYFEGIYSDVNGNGKVEIATIDCSIGKDMNTQIQSDKLMKMQAMLAAESDALIYLVDEDSIKHFDNISEVELFPEENRVLLGQTFYDSISKENLKTPETKLYAILRAVDNTTLEGKDEAAYNAAKTVIERLKTEVEEPEN